MTRLLRPLDEPSELALTFGPLGTALCWAGVAVGSVLIAAVALRAAVVADLSLRRHRGWA